MMRIGEAAAAAGVTAKTLRFYEESGLLPAAKRSSNGYRAYNQESVTRLDFIRRGRAAGLALAQIREILALRDAGETPCTHVQGLLTRQLADLDNQIAELMALRSAVAGLHATVAARTSAGCDPDRICSYL
ncbi:MerR family copper efflux transcriptional regulator [Arthrobacter sp. UYNi723]